MKALVVDTTSMIRTQIGLINGDSKIELNLEAPRSQEQKLLSLIDQGLQALNLELKDLDWIGVTLGPGSFTGLRIGISAVRTLAYSLKIPIRGADSIWCLAESTRQNFYCSQEVTIVPVIDAKMKRVYASLYQNGDLQTPPMDISPENLIEKLQDITSPILVGDGVETYLPLFREKLPSAVLLPGLIGGLNLLDVFSQEHPQIIKEFQFILPIYLRKSQAEEMLDQKTN